MRKRAICSCGSGKAHEQCCGKSPQIKASIQPLAHPGQQQEFLKKLQIGSQFEMRFRALTWFYGDELIAYKLGKPKDPSRNEFLRIFSGYMTDYLEDLCPSSWKECTPAFWEELITTFLPGKITISKTGTEAEKFLYELKKFVRWLDRRTGTSWYRTVEEYAGKFLQDVKSSEAALNALILMHFPKIHDKDFDIHDALHWVTDFTETTYSMFQVISVIEDVFLLADVENGRTYHIKGLPGCIVPGLLLCGAIGKRKSDFFWNWAATSAVFPVCARKFFDSKNEVIILS